MRSSATGGWDLFRAGGRFVSLCGAFGLLGDDHVLDFDVGSLGNDLLLHQFILGAVGPPVDDLLRVGITDARQFLELIFRGRVDVEFLGGRFCSGCGSG